MKRLVLLMIFVGLPVLAKPLATRPGVTIPLNTFEAKKPTAVLILLVGGAGFPNLKNPNIDLEENFFVRVHRYFAEHDLTVIIPGMASDKRQGGYGKSGKAVEFRWSPEHMTDLSHIVKFAKETYKKDVFIVGSSLGAVSAVAYASEGKDDIAGVVVVSGYLSRGNKPGLARFDINKVKVPLYVVHHSQDACGGSKRAELEGWLMGSLVMRDKIYIEGGRATGDPCGPLHYHGFEGKEKEAVEAIAAWIKQKTKL